jgi:hypothetical protein
MYHISLPFHAPFSDSFSIRSRSLLRLQVINLLHVHTLEMRGLRPEASAHSLLALMQLFEGRLAALRALSEPLVYHSQNLAHLVSWSVHRHMEEYKVDIADADIEQVPPQCDKLANTVSSCRIFASAYSFSYSRLVDSPSAMLQSIMFLCFLRPSGRPCIRRRRRNGRVHIPV